MKKLPMFALLLAAGATAAAANDSTGNVTVEHLGTNNTLVRIKPDNRFLILPVQESNEDAAVNVLVDGKLDRTIYVRLAKTRVD